LVIAGEMQRALQVRSLAQGSGRYTSGLAHTKVNARGIGLGDVSLMESDSVGAPVSERGRERRCSKGGSGVDSGGFQDRHLERTGRLEP
jgi:hypothetical protein